MDKAVYLEHKEQQQTYLKNHKLKYYINNDYIYIKYIYTTQTYILYAASAASAHYT